MTVSGGVVPLALSPGATGCLRCSRASCSGRSSVSGSPPTRFARCASRRSSAHVRSARCRRCPSNGCGRSCSARTSAATQRSSASSRTPGSGRRDVGAALGRDPRADAARRAGGRQRQDQADEGHRPSVYRPPARAARHRLGRVADGVRPAARCARVPGRGGKVWRDGTWQSWHRDNRMPIKRSTGTHGTRPYDLRHSSVSLLIHEGVSIMELHGRPGIRRR